MHSLTCWNVRVLLQNVFCSLSLLAEDCLTSNTPSFLTVGICRQCRGLFEVASLAAAVETIGRLPSNAWYDGPNYKTTITNAMIEIVFCPGPTQALRPTICCFLVYSTGDGWRFFLAFFFFFFWFSSFLGTGGMDMGLGLRPRARGGDPRAGAGIPTRIYTSVHLQLLCIYINIYIQVYIYTNIYLFTYLPIYIYAYIHIYIYTYIHIYIYTYTHIYIHTYIYTYIHIYI